MANKPVLFAVDDDREVLRAVERDLRRRYGRGRNGDGYRVLSADSAAAMDTLGKLTLRGAPVALFLVDQRMPRKSGVEFLEEARELYPGAKKVLLTAYADTDAAIKAINDIGWTTISRSPGTRPRRASTRSSTTSSATGAPPTGHPSRASGWSATAGRPGRMQ